MQQVNLGMIGGGTVGGGVFNALRRNGHLLASRVRKVAKRLFGVPEFHYYALADGIRVLLSRLPALARRCNPHATPTPPPQLWLFRFP